MGDEKARLGLAFMYNAPGSLKDQEKQKQHQQEQDDSSSLGLSAAQSSNKTKNIQCLKCKRWGHANTDRSCPLYGKSRLDEDADFDFDSIMDKKPYIGSSASTESKSEHSKTSNAEAIAEVKKEAIDQNDSDDDQQTQPITLEMLRALPKKQKKILLKRLIKLEKKSIRFD